MASRCQSSPKSVVSRRPSQLVEGVRRGPRHRTVLCERGTGCRTRRFAEGTHLTARRPSPAVEYSVRVHEVAHELPHAGNRRAIPTKTVRETEAEAVALVASHAIGLDTSTEASDYIQLHRGDKETLLASLAAIQRTAAEILHAISCSRLNRGERSDFARSLRQVSRESCVHRDIGCPSTRERSGGRREWLSAARTTFWGCQSKVIRSRRQP
jgi:hypothetical protein